MLFKKKQKEEIKKGKILFKPIEYVTEYGTGYQIRKDLAVKKRSMILGLGIGLIRDEEIFFSKKNAPKWDTEYFGYDGSPHYERTMEVTEDGEPIGYIKETTLTDDEIRKVIYEFHEIAMDDPYYKVWGERILSFILKELDKQKELDKKPKKKTVKNKARRKN